MKLSILILTLPSRVNNFFPNIINSIMSQVGDRKDIEVLALFDNKVLTVGEKRNRLIQMAQGEYLTFIDDDDRISEEYIEHIMSKVDEGNDVIVFDSEVTVNGMNRKRCKYGIGYSYVDGPTLWTGLPAHTMVWKSEIAKKHLFPETNYGEDTNWVQRAVADLKTESRIEEILYYYDMNYATSETRV